MKLYSWNVNGIRAVINKGAFDLFLKSEDPDIICLQETKAEKSQVVIDLPDYFEYWNSAVKKGYSGTAIFSKAQPLTVMYGFSPEITTKYRLAHDGYGDVSQEGRVLTAEFDKFYVVNVYTPNAKDDLTRLELRDKSWDPAFLEHLEELGKHKPVLTCGDFNVAHKEIDLARPKENVGKHGFTNEERQGFENMISAGFIDTFRLFNNEGENYTWWSNWGGARARNVGWRIDYWLASEKLKPIIKDAKIHSTIMGSDHCPVSVTLEI